MSDTSKLVAEIVARLETVPLFSDANKADLQRFVQEYCDAGQAVVGRSQKGEDAEKIFGIAFWARVTEQTEPLLRDPKFDPVKTGLSDLGKGERPWVVQVVANPETVKPFLKSIGESVFPGEDFKVRLNDDKNSSQVIAVSRT